jgi:galactonate dehydratase
MGLLFIESRVGQDMPRRWTQSAGSRQHPDRARRAALLALGFQAVLASGAVDIIQPDLSHAGGLTECRKIAAMAEAYDVAVAPHCPLGPLALAACLQLAGCTPNVISPGDVAGHPLQPGPRPAELRHRPSV